MVTSYVTTRVDSVICPRHLSRLATPGTGSKTTWPRRPTQPIRNRKIRNVCRQHSYIKVPGMTRSSTKWQTMNQSPGWMSASARIKPSLEEPTGRVEGDHSMHQGHPANGQRERIVKGEPIEWGTERAARSPCRSASTWRSSRRVRGHRDQVGRRQSTRGRLPRPDVETTWDDPLASGELLGREEARAAVSHRQERLAGDRRIELEPEQNGLSLAEEAGDPDVVTDHFARDGETAMEGHGRVEEPIDGQPLGFEVHAQIAREEEVGLARLDRDARGDALAVEVPRTFVNEMLGDNPPALQRTRPALDCQDASTSIRGSSGRRTRVGKAVDRREVWPQHRRDRSHGELKTLARSNAAGVAIRTGESRKPRAALPSSISLS